MYKFSIIVPIYNCSLYLRECLDSLVNQTYENFEIILINDGSTDNSLDICYDYSKKYDFVYVYDKKNEGVSKTRNFGMNVATGEYFLFVDSDDVVTNDFVEVISKYMNQDSFLVFGFTKMFKNRNVDVVNSKLTDADSSTLYNNIFISDYVGGYMCNKCFSANIIKDNNLFLKDDLHYCEDMVFVSEYFNLCNKFVYIPDVLYYYRMRKSSATFNYINKKNVSILKSYEILINKNSNNEIVKNNLFYRYLVNYYKLKSLVDNSIINTNIISMEKDIIKSQNLSFVDLFEFFIIKHFNFMYILLKKIKDKMLKLFD